MNLRKILEITLRCLAHLAVVAVVAALALSLSGVARAQAPDFRGEAHTAVPTYRGESASAPIPPSLHVKNEGGSDGAGLCVISSILANGMYQGVPGLEGGKGSQLWRTAKSRPGGYEPGKLTRLIDEVHPGEGKFSYYGSDTRVLDRLSRDGYPIGATMGTGARYGYRPIAHMVSLLHYREDGAACVVDNNFPGEYTWMPAGEFARRWKSWGEGWAWIWTRKPGEAAGVEWVVVLVAIGAAGVVLYLAWPGVPT